MFWALRGGGGGTFGVVSKLTMRTHPMPSTVGIVAGAIRAATNEDFRNLIRALVRFLPDLCDDHWGEQVRLSGDNTAGFFMTVVDVPEAEHTRSGGRSSTGPPATPAPSPRTCPSR